MIATRDRAGYLLDAVRSLVGQTVLPRELCIVDASEATPSRAAIEELCAEAGIELDYVHPAPQGLTVQRNLGVDRTAGDPVFLVDDDVRMEPTAHEEVLAEYERWGPELGGVRGTALRPPVQRPLPALWRRVFGLDAWGPGGSGRVRPSFFADALTESGDVRRVESFNGWFMSFRRAVFEHERFDERLAGYAFREDTDFSYRVSKRGYVLLQTPRARAEHLKTPSQRLSPFELQRMNMANHLYLHRKNMPQTAKYRAALWWAMTGALVLNVGKAVQTRDPGYVTGMIAGAWDQVRGRGLDAGARPGRG
ncbi:MAG TPA: glycosyltransferase [Gaiellaceae bacterium]|nr:glycosyltransferase [Gaiellaceae bacterium]